MHLPVTLINTVNLRSPEFHNLFFLYFWSSSSVESARYPLIMISCRLDLNRQRQRCFLVSLSLTLLIISWSTVIFPSQTTKPIKQTVLPYAKSLLNSVKAHDRLSTQDVSHIAPHVSTPTFEYAQRKIRTHHLPAEHERPTLTQVDQALLPDFQLFTKDNLTRVSLAQLPTLTLNVPLSPQVDTSILSFAISTKLTRLKSALPQLKHWLPHSNAQLYVSVPPEPSPSSSYTFQEIESSYRTAAINLTLHVSDLPFAKSYFNLIKILYEARTSKTKWLVLIDDDTFVPSLPHLVQHLTSKYNPENEVLVAALSDSLSQIRDLGLIPFGGGGIFISVPLAASLVRPEVWDACLTIPNDQGDQVVNECLNAHSSVRPSFDYGLNQMDIRGDASGYFESGRRMLTVHHWRTWYDVDVPLASNVSNVCGFECIFQRWVFDDDFVLSNGFSVVEYTSGIMEGGVELEKVEKTWDGEVWNFMHHGGPLRQPTGTEEKRSARLVEASVVERLGVRQIYVERVESGKNGQMSDGDIDRVVELLWLF